MLPQVEQGHKTTFVVHLGSMGEKKIIFLDRDGTLNIDHGYVSSPNQFQLLPGVIEALTRLQNLGFELVIVTNQSGIARKLYTAQDLEQIHSHMLNLLRPHGITFLSILHCPHHPEGLIAEFTRTCTCRKPGTGMLEQATQNIQFSKAKSYMVGDRTTDIVAGHRFGVTPVWLQDPAPKTLPMEIIGTNTLVFPRLLDFALSL